MYSEDIQENDQIMKKACMSDKVIKVILTGNDMTKCTCFKTSSSWPCGE